MMKGLIKMLTYKPFIAKDQVNVCDPYLLGANIMQVIESLNPRACDTCDFIFPPNLVMDYDILEVTSEDDARIHDKAYGVKCGSYNSQYLTFKNRGTMESMLHPVMTEIVMYPLAICKVLETEFDCDPSKNEGYELFLCRYVHDVIHEYAHHRAAVQAYQRYMYRKKMTGSTFVALDEYERYLQFCHEAESLSTELDIEEKALELLPHVYDVILRGVVPNQILNAFIVYFDCMLIEHHPHMLEEYFKGKEDFNDAKEFAFTTIRDFVSDSAKFALYPSFLDRHLDLSKDNSMIAPPADDACLTTTHDVPDIVVGEVLEDSDEMANSEEEGQKEPSNS